MWVPIDVAVGGGVVGGSRRGVSKGDIIGVTVEIVRREFPSKCLVECDGSNRLHLISLHCSTVTSSSYCALRQCTNRMCSCST